MNTEETAKDILDYCILYLTGNNKLKEKDFNNPKKLYKEMLKEVEFMIDTD